MSRIQHCLVLVLAALSLAAPAKADDEREIAAVTRMLAHGAAARYLAQDCAIEDGASWGDYAALPAGSLQRCSYAVTQCGPELTVPQKQECLAHRQPDAPRKIRADVVLLVPTDDRIARWVVSACKVVGGSGSHCLWSVYKQGQAYGGWQIPIAGIVYEPLPATNFAQHGCALRDGLTVHADGGCGWQNGTADGSRAPSPQQTTACSRPGAEAAAFSRRSRPMGATRDMVVAYRPELAPLLPPLDGAPVDGGPPRAAWAHYVRLALIAAMSSDENPLVTAMAIDLCKQQPLSC